MTDREAMKQAMYLIDAWQRGADADLYFMEIADLRQALAQGEQEPVAWIVTTKNVEQKVCWVFNSQEEAMLWSAKHLKIGVIKPLYTTPPSKPWVSLTDHEIAQLDFTFKYP